MTCYKCYLDIGTMPKESVPHPLLLIISHTSVKQCKCESASYRQTDGHWQMVYPLKITFKQKWARWLPTCAWWGIIYLFMHDFINYPGQWSMAELVYPFQAGTVEGWSQNYVLIVFFGLHWQLTLSTSYPKRKIRNPVEIPILLTSAFLLVNIGSS